MPSVVKPSLKVTVPVGVGALPATVAVNVTDCPKEEGSSEEVNVTEPAVTPNARAAENSEVLFTGSVAVAVNRDPAANVTGNATLKPAFPEPSVVTFVEPR